MSWPTCDRDGCHEVLGSNWKVHRVQVDDATMDVTPDGQALTSRTAWAFCSLDCAYWHLHRSGRVDVDHPPEQRPVDVEPF